MIEFINIEIVSIHVFIQPINTCEKFWFPKIGSEFELICIDKRIWTPVNLKYLLKHLSIFGMDLNKKRVQISPNNETLAKTKNFKF
tara:strand:+ start:469 stop:726 length:258 start_codon:yes stop_codon:yes gene_type:complete